MSWQIFNILMGGINDFCQFFAIDHFLVDVHGDTLLELGKVGTIGTHNLGDSGAPKTSNNHKKIRRRRKKRNVSFKYIVIMAKKKTFYFFFLFLILLPAAANMML